MGTESNKPDYGALLKQSFRKLEELQARIRELERGANEPIAVIGVACRFPGGATDPEAFWKLLSDGVDTVRKIPKDRWDADAFFDAKPGAPGKMYTREGAFVDDVDQFDPQFFGIAPREAIGMDPQHRLLLEVNWEALERAGQSPAVLAGTRTGVYVGICSSDYMLLQTRGSGRASIDTYSGSGGAHSIASGRLSYLLGVHGPSVSVDTACSSSLVAVHLACQSLRTRESDMALASGVSLILTPDGTIIASQSRMLAPDGRCKTFDASADGYGRAEGCAAIVLKRLSDAVAAGDHVLAVIRGSAANQDGRSNGLTAPNGRAQEAVLRAALANAGMSPARVGYVEAHGTGTSLGDPIEVQSLNAVFGTGRPLDRPLAIGSVKSNIGHLEASAGIAGLIKAILCLQHGELPPSLHVRKLNPLLAWDEMPVKVVTALTPWPATTEPRVAGVSSFGFSGTNVHVIVEEAPVMAPPTETTSNRPSHVLTLSAKSDVPLHELAGRVERQLAVEDAPFRDVCFTSNSGRSHFTHRLALVASSREEAVEKLIAFRDAKAAPGLYCGAHTGARAPQVAFLFTGQGSQHAGMGRQLYETQPVFQEALDRCDRLLQSALGRSIKSILHPAAGDPPLIDQTGFTQPALFALEFALAELWRAWGIRPSIVAGHSVGEYVAACVAGVFSLEDALTLIAERGRLMQSLPAGGGMAAVFAPEATVDAAIRSQGGAISIAAVNGPAHIVVAGPVEEVSVLGAGFAAQGIRVERLTVSHAFHSGLMDPILAKFGETAARITFNAPRLPLVSNLTGRVFSGSDVPDASYWQRHLRHAVRFADGMQTIRDQGATLFLEIGPGTTLLGMGRTVVADESCQWLPSLSKRRDDCDQVLQTLAALYTSGVDVDWTTFDRPWARRKVVLPTYPFQRSRFWTSVPKPSPDQAMATDGHPLLGRRVDSPKVAGAILQAQVAMDSPAFLQEHRIFDRVIVPGAAFVEMALSAAVQVCGDGLYSVDNVSVLAPLALPDGERRTVQTIVNGADDPNGSMTFEIHSANATQSGVTRTWTLHASGELRRTAEAEPASVDARVRGEWESRCAEQVDGRDYYERLRESGVDYGSAFRRIEDVRRRDGEVVARLSAPEGQPDTTLFRVQPALLDASFQALGLAIRSADDAGGDVYMPIGVERVTVRAAAAGSLWCHGVLRPAGQDGGDMIAGDLQIFDATGRVVVDVAGIRFKRATRDALRRSLGGGIDEWLYEVAWRPAGAPEANGSAQGSWLVFADRSGVGAQIADVLAREGVPCTTVSAGSSYREDPDGFTIDPREPGDVVRMLSAVRARDGHAPAGVVHLWSLDLNANGEASAERALDLGVGSVLHLVQASAAADHAPASILVVTRGAQPAGGAQQPANAEQAPVWGLVRTIAVEKPELDCRVVDLDQGLAPKDDASCVLAEMHAARAGEPQTAYRDGVRLVPRLTRSTPALQARVGLQIPEGSYALTIANPGVLDDLVLTPSVEHAPAAGEVQILPTASGLNFRDVLSALGMYPGTAPPLGSECVGHVVAVGAGVEEFKPGDRVVAITNRAFSTSVCAPAQIVQHVPAGMSDEEAVTIPTAFLTAHYALTRVGKMKAGDRVLIHAAAGGVGLAAVGLARRAGAEVFATAGSPEKRAFLRSLGVAHVMDSRSTRFAQQIREETAGAGVDIVLNSLTGDFIDKSFSVLRAGGRFVEIGKTDIRDAERVARAAPGVAYTVLDLGAACRDEPAAARAAFAEIMSAMEAGDLKPLPRTVFGMTAVRDAFRFMAQARHTGKVVVLHAPPAGAFRANATYLITGGAGGLGLAVARWMVERGARHLILVGRSGASTDAQATLAELARSGAVVTVVRADVADLTQMESLLAGISPARPLRGVVHAAGCLDDGVVGQLTRERMARVMAPKVQGGWNLHLLTQGAALDFFVLFSAGAALFGSAGQGNYAAANAFLDALAHHRRARALPAVSINWGAWAEVGMAARLVARDRTRWTAAGLGLIEPAQGIESLHEAMRRDRPQIAVMPIEWRAFVAQFGGRDIPAFVAELALSRSRSTAAAPAIEDDVLIRLEAAEPPERCSMMQDHVREQVVRVLGLDPGVALRSDQGFTDLGMDSLMAVELSNRLKATLRQPLPSTLAFEQPTIEDLSAYLLDRVLKLAVSSTRDDARATIVAEAALEDFGDLSEDEVERTLTAELDRAGY